MAVVLGVSSGFVTTAPTADPEGVNIGTDTLSWVTKDTSPATATKIIEIGWYNNNATEETNFELGLYADSTGVPGTLLEVSRTNAKGTSSGWKSVTVDWNISSETDYWFGLQVDDTATQTSSDAKTSSGSGLDSKSGTDTLPDPFDGGSLQFGSGMIAIYAIWEAPTGTNLQINIGDVWKEVPAIQINIGDAWKEVAGMQINIGDSWKTIF